MSVSSFDGPAQPLSSPNFNMQLMTNKNIQTPPSYLMNYYIHNHGYHSRQMNHIIQKKKTFKSKNSHLLPTKKNEDVFLLIKIEGTKLDEIEDCENKLQELTDRTIDIFDLEETGNATLNVIDKNMKNSYFFAGHEKSIQLTYSEIQHQSNPYQFVSVN